MDARVQEKEEGKWASDLILGHGARDEEARGGELAHWFSWPCPWARGLMWRGEKPPVGDLEAHGLLGENVASDVERQTNVRYV